MNWLNYSMKIDDINIKKIKNLPIQIKASGCFLLCSFMQKGVSVITTPIFTRLFTTSEYGKYNVLLSWQSILGCIVVLNIFGGMYAQGLVKREGQERRRFASSMQGLALTLVLGWEFLYIIFRKQWNAVLTVNTSQMVLTFLIIWETASYNLWAVEKRVEFQYKEAVEITMVTSIMTPIFGIIFVSKCSDKVTARLLATALVGAVVYSILCVMQLRKGHAFFSRTNWKYAMTFCIPLVPHYLSQVVLNSSDRIMIQKLVDDSSAGIYSLAYSVSLLMTLFGNSLLQTIEPWIYQKLKENKENKIRKVAYFSLVCVSIVNIFLIATAPEIIKIFAPAGYYDAIWIVPPVTMSVYFMFMYSLFAIFSFYFEKPYYITIATVTGAIINIVLNYIFIQKYGYYAAGYTTLVCYIIYAIMHYIFMRRIINEKMEGIKIYNIWVIITISGIFIMISIALMFTYSLSVVRYVFLILFLTLIVIKRNYILNVMGNIIKE